MENLKLISVRLDPEVLREIDKIASQHSYFTRNSIINILMGVVVKASAPGTLWKILSTPYYESKGYEIRFEINPDKQKREKEYKPVER